MNTNKLLKKLMLFSLMLTAFLQSAPPYQSEITIAPNNTGSERKITLEYHGPYLLKTINLTQPSLP